MRWLKAPGFNRDELDESLKELVLTAKQHPTESAERQSALADLYTSVLNSKKLWYPPKHEFNQYVYEEANQELWCYICASIEKYEPEKGSVIAWINTLLNRRFYPEARNEYLKTVLIQNEYLETIQKEENTISILEKILEYIELDPENIFNQAHIENHPEANFQTLTKYRRSQLMWKDICDLTGIKESTLINFYQRCIKKFTPKIKEYLIS